MRIHLIIVVHVTLTSGKVVFQVGNVLSTVMMSFPIVTGMWTQTGTGCRASESCFPMYLIDPLASNGGFAQASTSSRPVLQG